MNNDIDDNSDIYADDEMLQERMENCVDVDKDEDEGSSHPEECFDEEDEEPDHASDEDNYWFGRE